MLLSEQLDGDREGPHIDRLEDGQRAGEFVPETGKGKDRECSQRRFRQRQDDPGENRESPGTIDDGAVLDLTRDGLEESPKKESVVSNPRPDVKQDQSGVTVDQADRIDEQELRNDVQQAGYHQTEQIESKQLLLEPEVEPGERIGRHRRYDHGGDGRNRRNEHRVHEVFQEVVRRQRGDEITKIKGCGNQNRRIGHDVGIGGHRRGDHVHERKCRRDRKQD